MAEKSYLDMYIDGMSISEISADTGIALSTLRFRLKKAGVLRSRADAVRLAAAKGKLSTLKGRKRVFTEEWKQNISSGRLKYSAINSMHFRLSPNGYHEFTTGENKGRNVHVVVMESWLGRNLFDFECVHHIDEDKTNNTIDNLALVTRSGHSRLHQIHRTLAGKENKRDEITGRYTNE